MGQCVLRDCGLEHPNPPSHLHDYLKQHLQDKYFDNFLKKPSNQAPIKNVNFNSSMEYTPKPNNLHTMLPKISKIELKTTKSTEKEAMTEKITPLIHNHKVTEESFPKFDNQNYKPTTSEIGYAYEEDLLGGSLDIMNEEKIINTHQNKSKFFEGLIPTEQSTSNIFQNQIFDMNTTPSGIHYRSDEDNLEEYQKIFQDDEFDDTYEEDYIKKLRKERL